MDGHMIDTQGRYVPAEKVKPEDKLMDQLVNDMISTAKHQSNRLKDFKEQSFIDVQALMSLLSEKYGSKRGGGKGNLTLQSYDGMRKVTIQNADFIQFGPQLKIAKELVDECLTKWSKDADVNLKAIVDRAFQVNKEGKINTAEILSLRRLDIKDETWQRAMTAIEDSIKITATKSYIRFYERPNLNSDWVAISLDLARV